MSKLMMPHQSFDHISSSSHLCGVANLDFCSSSLEWPGIYVFIAITGQLNLTLLSGSMMIMRHQFDDLNPAGGLITRHINCQESVKVV